MGARDSGSDGQRGIEEFLDRYRKAFNRLDGDAIAELFATPSGLLSGETYVHWRDRADVAANMRALCEVYRRDGYVSAEYRDVEIVRLGASSVFVNVSWTIDRGPSLVPRRFRTAYNLVQTGSGWRVLLCTAYEEGLLSSR